MRKPQADTGGHRTLRIATPYTCRPTTRTRKHRSTRSCCKSALRTREPSAAPRIEHAAPDLLDPG
eukprot:2999638-Prymnesium_polylepis.1